MRVSSLRRLARIGLLVGVGSLASSCLLLQPSLNPLFLPADTTFDARLVGTWTCGAENWTFEKHADKDWGPGDFYQLTLAAAGHHDEKFFAWVGYLGASEFINFFPGGTEPDGSQFFVNHLIAAYTFGRVWITDDHLRFGMLDPQWVDHAVDDGRIRVATRRWPEQTILIAPPRELQHFAFAYMDDTDAFGELVELARPVKPAAAPAKGKAPSVVTVAPAGECAYTKK